MCSLCLKVHFAPRNGALSLDIDHGADNGVNVGYESSHPSGLLTVHVSGP
jgi:hypothetical protein